AVPVSLAPVQCARTPPVCQVTPPSTRRPVEGDGGLVVARDSGKNSPGGNTGAPGPGARGAGRRGGAAADPVTSRSYRPPSRPARGQCRRRVRPKHLLRSPEPWHDRRTRPARAPGRTSAYVPA